MCYDRSWFVSHESKAKAEKPDTKDKRSETVDALLRASSDSVQKAKAERAPVKEPVPAK